MAIKYLKTANIKNKTVLVRGSLDANVDEETNTVSDDFRLRSFLPTVEFLLAKGNKVIICGKRKRAKGKAGAEFSLKPAAESLANLLGMDFAVAGNKNQDFSKPTLIFYAEDIRQQKNQEQIKNINYPNVVFLENLEFYPEELDNEETFGKILGSLAGVYVNDDFAKCHHAVASNVSITKFLPSYAGLLLEKEIKFLNAVLKNAAKPFVVMTGGIKLSEKVGALENLGKMADKILVGGGVANLFFLNKGYEIGLSKVEEEEKKTAWRIEKNFKDKIVLPIDVVVAHKDMHKDSIRVCSPHQIGKDEIVLDAGPKTILEFAKHIKSAKTVVWSGPLGMFEKRPFHHASFALSRLIGGRGKGKAFVVAGGGDTVDAIRQSHQFEHIDHVSTGGGAMLEYLAGEKLPGIEALK